MTDELDVLRHERGAIEPDPEFRADLMDRLRDDMAASGLASERAPVIDLDGPLTAPTRSDDGAQRLRRLVAVAAAIAVIAVGVVMVQRQDREPNVTSGINPDDQALADMAVLTPEEGGWPLASPEQEAQLRAEEDALDAALSDCLGMDVSETQADHAHANALFVDQASGNLQHLVSKATVLSSSAEARVVTDQMGLPAAQDCYGKVIEQQILERARDGLTNYLGRPLAVDDLEVRGSSTEAVPLEYPAVGEDGYPASFEIPYAYNALLLKVTLGADNAEVDVYTSVAFVTKGRVAMQLLVQTYFDESGLGHLAKLLLDRIPPVEAVDQAEPVDPVDPAPGEPELPDPGEPPADAATAEEQVRLAYTGIFDASSTREARSRFSERPAVWSAANQQLQEGEYGGFVEDLSAVVDEVVFIDPTHAAVRFRLTGTQVPIPQAVDIGEAVLVDGRWLVAIETTCTLVASANVSCDMSL
jgi:hypothetical protein